MASSLPTVRRSLQQKDKSRRRKTLCVLCGLRVDRVFVFSSGFRFGIAALSQHKGHEGHHDKTSSFPFVSFVSIVFDQRRGSHTPPTRKRRWRRSEEHTSELQSLAYLVCRLLLEKKKKTQNIHAAPAPS